MTSKLAFAEIGYGSQINDPHLCVFLAPHKIHIYERVRIDAFVKIEGGQGVDIGSGTHISSFAHLNIGGGVLKIGANVAVTSGVAILSGTNTMAGRAMSSASPQEMQVVERKTTIIEDFAFIGSHAVVYPGIRIGCYAVVKAGAVVTKDVEPYQIVAGIPARVVGDRRDMEGWEYV